MPKEGRRRVTHDVRAPSALEGVGNALRSAYSAPSCALPVDFASLLDRLR